MWEEGILKGETSKPHPILELSSMLCIIFGLPYICEERAFTKEKPSSRTDFGTVFYVVYYLWLTVHMWEEGILKGETSRSRIEEAAKRGTGHRLHNIWRCNFTQLEIKIK